jgi:hypothetical protein
MAQTTADPSLRFGMTITVFSPAKIQGPEARKPNVSPVRKHWESNASKARAPEARHHILKRIAAPLGAKQADSANQNSVLELDREINSRARAPASTCSSVFQAAKYFYSNRILTNAGRFFTSNIYPAHKCGRGRPRPGVAFDFAVPSCLKVVILSEGESPTRRTPKM